MRSRALVILAILVIAAGLAVVFRDRVTNLTGDQIAGVIYGLMALMVVGGGFYAGRAVGVSRTWLRDALIWVCVILAIALAFPVIAPLLPERFLD